MDFDSWSLDKLDSIAHAEVKCERTFRELLGKKYVKTYNIKKSRRKKLQSLKADSKDELPSCSQPVGQFSIETAFEDIKSEEIDSLSQLNEKESEVNEFSTDDEMDIADVGSQESDVPIRVETKCEREFRKLLESTNIKNSINGDTDKTTIKDTCSLSKEIQTTSEVYHQIPLAIITEMRKEDMEFETLSKMFHHHNMQKKSCSVLSLALFCLKDMTNLDLHTVFEALHHVSYTHDSNSYAVSYSLLLLALSKRDLSLSQISSLENLIIRLTDEILTSSDDFRILQENSKLSVLEGELYRCAVKVCQQCLSDNVETDLADVFTICCFSLKNLSITTVGKRHRYSENTLKFILGMTGKATQDIVSEYLIYGKQTEDTVSASSHLVNQCLLILEHILTLDPDFPCTTLDHEDFSILHCLTRLLGWCVSYLFRDYPDYYIANTDNSLSSFHLSTLVLILKILSILSFNPNQYNNFTNVKGLMEKVMICILKVYFHSSQKHFDVLVLALELMINFFIKHKKTFALLCLKNFSISKCEQILGIEALLKMLHNSLDKIAEIKAKSLNPPNNDESTTSKDNNSPTTPTDDNEAVRLQLVLADEDMELSTIVSFISILVAFFMEIKVSFTDFIRERLPVERSTDAVTVSKKVLQFASITGGMPATGVLLLRHAIRKLTGLYTPS